MITGYEKPLAILPFDHRHSYITGVFHWQEPLTPDQVAEIAASKQLIYDGFKAAVVDPAVRGSRRDPRRRAFGAVSSATPPPTALSHASLLKRADRTSSISNTAKCLRSTLSR